MAFFGILLSLMIAALAMSFRSVSVITNALRLRRLNLNKLIKIALILSLHNLMTTPTLPLLNDFYAKFDVSDVKFDVPDVKFDVADAKFDVADVKFDVADVKFGVLITGTLVMLNLFQQLNRNGNGI